MTATDRGVERFTFAAEAFLVFSLAVALLDLLALCLLLLETRGEPLETKDALAIELRPDAPTDAPAADVRLMADGRIFLAGRRVTLDQLRTRLCELVELDPEQGVALMAAPGASAAAARGILRACRDARVRGVGLVRPAAAPGRPRGL